jgi:hypothetical protein
MMFEQGVNCSITQIIHRNLDVTTLNIFVSPYIYIRHRHLKIHVDYYTEKSLTNLFLLHAYVGNNKHYYNMFTLLRFKFSFKFLAAYIQL